MNVVDDTDYSVTIHITITTISFLTRMGWDDT